jgi:DNA polymerase epsilon subunit 1
MPMLRRYADGLMHKIFKALVEKLSALGATIVYASLKNIVLCTGKTSQYTAMAYTRYLIDTIQSEPLFKLLVLEPKKVWSQLLFMDRFNFAGFAGKYKELEGEGWKIDEGEESEPAEIGAEITDDDMQTDATNPDSQPPATLRDECDWNIAEFLPKQVQKHFLANILDFLDKCMQHRDVMVGDGPSQAGFGTQMQRKQKSDDFVKSLFVNRCHESICWLG